MVDLCGRLVSYFSPPCHPTGPTTTEQRTEKGNHEYVRHVYCNEPTKC